LDAPSLNAPSLADLQRWLRWIITDPRGVDAALAGQAGEVDAGWIESEPKPRQLGMVVATPTASSVARVGIYASGYFWRLHDALAADFPGVREILGAGRFQRLAAEYLIKHPSRSPNLADLGCSFSRFSLDRELREEFPFLPDLASLEWSIHLSLLAPRGRGSALTSVGAGDWSSARLRLDPTVRLLTTEWAVASFWRRIFAKSRPAAPQRRRQWLLVYRDDVWVQVKAVTRPQWSALLRLQQGCPLGWVCEQLAAESRGSHLRIREWFRRWISSGLISGVELAA